MLQTNLSLYLSVFLGSCSLLFCSVCRAFERMDLIGAVKLFLPLLLWLSIIISFSFSPSLAAGKHSGSWTEFRYPFIRKASSFSSNGGVDKAFDYIIIGGGTAGCPLATTLSQNFSVLLLERGGAPFANANVSFLSNFHLTLADISPTSASQFFSSTDGVLNSRARVLGGGTSINAGFYTRASTRFVRKVGWNEKLVNESYPWVEKQIVHWPAFSPWQRAFRNSLLEAGVSPFNGFTYDHVYGTKVGGTIFDRFGRRHTAAELLATGNPKKLTVLVHATVHKIVFDTSSGKRPRATGVIFKDENGNQHKAILSNNHHNEVILSSGAIGSPQMLLLSGIGPTKDLEKLNIPLVLNNPFVGKGMADNPMNAIFAPTNKPVKQSLIQTVGITKKGVYLESSSGYGQSRDSIRCHHGIMSAEIGQLSTIPPKQRSQEAIAAYIKRKHDLPREVFYGGFILEKLAYPVSKGELKLINTNVDDNPSVTFNYFSNSSDLKKCVEGIRLALKVVESKYFMNLTLVKETTDRLLNISVKANVNLVPRHPNDTKSLEQFCRDTVITIWHYHGGCHVGKVVSSEHKVLGVDRLRVIDGSTFSESPGTNPQATVMMMGRYMGTKILRERLRVRREEEGN